MLELFTITEAAAFLGVSKPTLRRWEKAGKLPTIRTAGNHRRYPKNWLLALLTSEPIQPIEEMVTEPEIIESRIPVIYARVSTYGQKKDGNLDRQIDRLREYAKKYGDEPETIIGENGSGMNTDRRGLDRLLKMVEKGKISRIYLEYPDRLTRFGFRYLERYCMSYGTTIICISDNIQRSPEEALAQDILTLLICFSGQFYSKRRGGKANMTEEEKIEYHTKEFIHKEVGNTIHQVVSTIA